MIIFIQNCQFHDNDNNNDNNNNDGKKMNFNCDTTYRYCLRVLTFFLINFLFLLNKKRLRERERFEKKQTVSSPKSSSKVISIDNTETEIESPKEPSVAESWRSMSLDALGTYMSLDFIISSEIIDA